MFRADVLYASRRSVMAAGLTVFVPGATWAGAVTPPLIVPEVESLSLQVVDDAATFGPFLPDLDVPGMKVVRAGNGGPNLPRMLPRALTGEFGLSILAESRRAGRARRVLVDFGYSREVLANNLSLLGIDPGRSTPRC